MEKAFKSLTIFEFQERFPDTASCHKHLFELKWADGFVCPNCKHTRASQLKGGYLRKCGKCDRITSPTSGTVFHKVKFDLLKAFYIVYYVSTCKKGISSTELSRKLGLRQKTCWLFKRKVMGAMVSSGAHPMEGRVDADETVIGGQEEGVVGRKNDKKKLVVIAIEHKGKGISRMYAKVLENAGSKQIRPFFEENVSMDAQVRTDGWRGYSPLKKDWMKLEQEKSGKKGNNFKQMHRVIMGLKSWLRGMHHSVKHLQAYLDEYCYRFNRNKMKEGIFDNLMKRMVTYPPKTYLQIIGG
jgi:transposase-like protein